MLTPLKKQLSKIVPCNFGVIDQNGNILMTSDENIDNVSSIVNDILLSSVFPMETSSYVISRIKPYRTNTFYFYLEKKVKNHLLVLQLLSAMTENFIKSYYDKFDRSHFLRSVIQREVTESNMKKKMISYKITNEKKRIVLKIKTIEKTNQSIETILNNLFSDHKFDYVIELDNCDIVYIMEVDEDAEEIAITAAKNLIATIEQELLIPVVVGIGKLVYDVTSLADSYESASLACEIGGIFESEKNIFTYSKLGIGVFISKLNKEELAQYLNMIIDVQLFSKLDEEIIRTIQKFFENNLNISETARKMYLHRNTLVYRIDKVLRQTGLDVRNFDDALLFKTAYMVKSYMEKLNDNT